MIEIKKISKQYGKLQVLKDVSAKVSKGGITALIGANAAGKSTLLAIMSGQLMPESGSVLIDGINVRDIPAPERAKTLSFLRQSHNPNVRLTIRELVEFGRFPHCRGKLKNEDLAAVESAMQYMNITDISEKFLDQLSGGQRQRAYIAMILAQDTEYVFLDEPLNNLDMKHASEMMQSLTNIAKDYNKTVIIVLHDINVAAAYADKVIALKNASVVFSGNVNELMDKKVLDEIYDHNFEIVEAGSRKVCVYCKTSEAV